MKENWVLWIHQNNLGSSLHLSVLHGVFPRQHIVNRTKNNKIDPKVHSEPQTYFYRTWSRYPATLAVFSEKMST